MNEYAKDVNESFSNIELEYLNTIKTNFSTKTDKTFFASVIEKFKNKPINGLIRAIEKDILGYYELDNTKTRILVIKKQYKNIDKNN